jgi:hypothetical protein
LNRNARKADDLDAVVAVAPELRDRMGGLPIGVTRHDEQINSLIGQA